MTTTAHRPVATRGCDVPGCERARSSLGLCFLHWRRQHATGTTDDPTPRSGDRNHKWTGDSASYFAIHLRLRSRPRPIACAGCGATTGRMEWALLSPFPPESRRISANGRVYSIDLNSYVNLCKKCHNHLDLSRPHCRKGHAKSGSNLYVRPSNGAKDCRLCKNERNSRARRNAAAARSARLEHGERP